MVVNTGRYKKQAKKDEFTALSCGSGGNCYVCHRLREEQSNKLLIKLNLLPVESIKTFRPINEVAITVISFIFGHIM